MSTLRCSASRFGIRFAIAIGVGLGEQPAEPLRRRFGHLGRDLGHLIVVLRVDVPMRDAQHVLHEIDHGGAVLVDERLARGPYDHLRHTQDVALLEQHLAFFLELGLNENGSTAGIRSAFFSSSMVGMAGSGPSSMV